MTDSKRFDLLKEACQECTSFSLVKGRDEDKERLYILVDGCGDQFGDPFYELDDVENYVMNNSEIAELLSKGPYLTSV